MEYIKKFDEFIEDQNYETIDELLQTVYTDEMLLEMANISQSTTGLDVIVWVQTNNTQSTGQHNLPRIKFQNNTATKVQTNELIPISIADEPILFKYRPGVYIPGDCPHGSVILHDFPDDCRSYSHMSVFLKHIEVIQIGVFVTLLHRSKTADIFTIIIEIPFKAAVIELAVHLFYERPVSEESPHDLIERLTAVIRP